jgi:hypothetical protein
MRERGGSVTVTVARAGMVGGGKGEGRVTKGGKGGRSRV